MSDFCLCGLNPFSVQLGSGGMTCLMEQGIRCVACGEPIWGTLESAAKEKGYSDAEINRFLEDLSRLHGNEALRLS